MLSARSARDKFSDDPAILIVNLSAGERLNNDKQILELTGDVWDFVYVNKKNKSKVRKFFDFIWMNFLFVYKYRGKINKFFLGELRNFDMVLMGNLLKSKDVVLLDDGSFTITAQTYYIKNGILPYAKSAKYKCFGFLLKKGLIPNLYSFFNLDSVLLEEQVNYFEPCVKRNVCVDKCCVFFFGSKFSEGGHVSLADELNILSFVLDFYHEGTVYYIPHRDESEEKLQLISHMGYVVKNLGKPAEVYFDEAQIMPGVVVSCYSTVLYTCYSKFENVALQSINIEKFILKPDTRINAEKIYSYYERIGIEVVHI